MFERDSHSTVQQQLIRPVEYARVDPRSEEELPLLVCLGAAQGKLELGMTGRRSPLRWMKRWASTFQLCVPIGDRLVKEKLVSLIAWHTGATSIKGASATSQRSLKRHWESEQVQIWPHWYFATASSRAILLDLV